MEPTILWADDEIELLKPHVMFLEGKGYQVKTVNNGSDAVDLVKDNHFDVIFLDENMPGLTGLETLDRIKDIRPHTPVIMITKSEEETIMEDAIGAKISDYLIKPVNPNQILLSLKKNLDHSRLVDEKTNLAYQQEFRNIGMQLSADMDWNEWKEIYQKLISWELKLDESSEDSMKEILSMQKLEANQQFSRYIERNYLDWLKGGDDAPVMSHTIFNEKVLPEVADGPVYLMMIDNLRLDQWKVLQSALSSLFTTKKDELYMSILPTATQFARNAFFAGLMPSEIQKKFPNKWVEDNEDGGKNMYEEDFLEGQLKRRGFQGKFSYHKITNLNAGRKLVDSFSNLSQNALNVIVYNFVDMLSHARTDMEVIRELAETDSAYRSLTASWFDHSPLYDMFRKIADTGGKVIVTTDHGTINVTEPSKIVGDRNTNTNLRYKQGKNLSYEKRDVFEVRNPDDAFLPRLNVSTTYVFAKDYKYFVYPNNYNHFVNFYKGTFQHGGISLEEMIIPFAVLSPR